jgi:molecular chaperone GrpE
MEEQDDVVIEPEVGAGDEATQKLAKLREELKSCRTEKQEYMDGWQRSKADYVNLLKRVEQDVKLSEWKGRVHAVLALLPTIEALERAKVHGEVPEGFQAIAKQLEQAFSTLGVVPIGEKGEQFDPTIHEALGTDITDSSETDNTVTAVLEKGWRIGETVVRPAKVRVAQLQP